MAAIVYQKDKRSGITYAYRSVSHWDKEKQQSRAKRTLIGRVDPDTGEIKPTRKRKKKDNIDITKSDEKHYFYGATFLFDKIGEKIGLKEDLKNCFPDTYKQILSIAYYLILEDKNSISRFPKWAAIHKHPYGESISLQRISDLLIDMSNDNRERFFYKQRKRLAEKELWAYDITSISSYSKYLNQEKNIIDNDLLAEINLAIIFGERSGLPFYYKNLDGNIKGSIIINSWESTLLKKMDSYGVKKVKLVMDHTSYSEANINFLYKDHRRFLMEINNNHMWIQKEIKKVNSTINLWENYIEQYKIYAQTSIVKWEYKENRPIKKDVLKKSKRMYVHIYYNKEKNVDKKIELNIKILKLKRELESGKTNPKNETQYIKYFNISKSKKNIITVNKDIVSEEESNFGYFTLISNDIKDARKALEIYRNKNLVEKCFNDLNDRLEFRKSGISLDISLDGKLFVEFIALIILTYIKKLMQEKEIFYDYTLQNILDELDLIECFEKSDNKLYLGEVTANQIKLFKDMNIIFPTSL